MSRDARVLDARPGAFLGKRIAVADATGFNLDSHLSRAGLWDFAFNEFKGSIRVRDLHDTHLRHSSSNRMLYQSRLGLRNRDKWWFQQLRLTARHGASSAVDLR